MRLATRLRNRPSSISMVISGHSKPVAWACNLEGTQGTSNLIQAAETGRKTEQVLDCPAMTEKAKEATRNLVSAAEEATRKPRRPNFSPVTICGRHIKTSRR